MIQFLIDGLVNGSIIALGAVGLSISYNVMRFANFAQGEVMAVGAYVSLGVLALMGLGIGKMGPVSFGWPLLVSIVFSIMMTSIVVLITDLLVFRRLRDKDSSRITFIIVAFGISLIARNVIHLAAGGDQQFYSFYIPRAVQVFEGLKIVPDDMLILLITVLCVVLMHTFLNRTLMGKKMRSVAENPSLARVIRKSLLGIHHHGWWTPRFPTKSIQVVWVQHQCRSGHQGVLDPGSLPGSRLRHAPCAHHPTRP